MVAKPHTHSAVHHHGKEGKWICVQSSSTTRLLPFSPQNQHCSCPIDTIVYAVKGHGTIVSGPDGSKRQDLSPGDFALIPAFTEHQEVNDGDEEAVWVITRGGRTPIVENLDGWGKS